MDSGGEDDSHGGAMNYSITSKKLTEIVHPFSNSLLRLPKINKLFARIILLLRKIKNWLEKANVTFDNFR